MALKLLRKNIRSFVKSCYMYLTNIYFSTSSFSSRSFPLRYVWFCTIKEFQQQLLQQQQLANNNGNNSDTKSNDSNTSNNNFPVEKTFNPTRRKGSTNDNKASTYNMNKYQAKLVGKHGGCPWRPPNFQYDRGIMG